MDQVVAIGVSAAQWDFAVGQLEEYLDLYADEDEEAAGRAVIAEVTPQLT